MMNAVEMMKRICVFCGASDPVSGLYVPAIERFADTLAARGGSLVYGGGKVGLMGVVADRVLAQGGSVLGVIPHQLERREVAHLGLTELIRVDSMHERKRIMYERSDAFVVFPGGFGTLDETMEILTWKQLAIHDKPIVLANLDGFYDGLLAWLERATHDGLLKPKYLPLCRAVTDVPAIFDYLDTYEAHRPNLETWG